MLKYFVALQAFFAARLRDDERGATMVEYGLMVALIAAVCIATVTLLGTSIDTKFTAVKNAIAGA